MHGHGNGTPTYKSWQGLWQRCTNPKDIHWARYGGRGLAVDAKWKQFPVFLADMGVRPPHCTLDRVDNDRGYSKDNCRWATASQQASNRSTSQRQSPALVDWLRRLKARGPSNQDLALVTGISRDTIRRWCSADARQDHTGSRD